MGIGGLKMFLEQMQSSIKEMMDITEKIQNGEVSSKDLSNIEGGFLINIYNIRRSVNTLSTFIAEFVDSLE